MPVAVVNLLGEADDLKREIIRMLDSEDADQVAEALNALNQRSSVRVDYGNVVKLLELEGFVKVLGERESRVIRRVSSD